MAINVVCPGCHARFKVSDQYAGKKGPCPKCKTQIEIPQKSEEVVIEAPDEFGGARDETGKLVLKPIERSETQATPLLIMAVVAGVVVVFLAAWGVRTLGADGDIPFALKALGAVLIAPPIAWLGYSFLRESELEPFSGTDLWLRIGICSVVYPLLWAGFSAAGSYLFSARPLESWSLLMLVVPFLVLGSLTAFASLDLTPTNAFFHYAFYVLFTVVLRLVVGLPAF